MFGVGAGIMAADRSWAGLAAALAYGALVVAAARRLGGARPSVLGITFLAYCMHVGLSSILFAGAQVLGREGFITGDDAEYFFLSRAFASYLHGQPLPPYVPPWWNADAYLFGTFVYLESGLFWLLGADPHLVLLLNGAAHVVTALLVYDMARRTFGDRAAFITIVAVLFFPSIVLWTSLNLKDSLALLLLTSVFWLLQRFQARPRPLPLILAFAALILMESLRRYLFVGILMLVPVAVAVSPALTPRRRAAWTAVSASVAIAFLAGNQSVSLGPSLISTFETTRQGMALNANTAYVQRPLRVNEGMRLVFGTLDPGDLPTPSSSKSPVVRNVPAEARIVVRSGPQPVSPEPNTAYVQPGEEVVVGPPGTTAGPEVRIVNAVERPVQLSEDTADTGIILTRTLAYLPTGVSHALLAPFPWALRRPLDWLTVPDVLLWYAALVLAVAGAWLERRRVAAYLTPLLLIAGLLGLFSLAEGNVGTLFRHRSMLLPFTIMLAAAAAARFKWRSAQPPVQHAAACDASRGQ